MLASALKASRLSQVRNARGYASAAGKIGDKKVPMSPLEQDRFINYQVGALILMLCPLCSDFQDHHPLTFVASTLSIHAAH